MTIETLLRQGKKIAVLSSAELAITDVQSALDLIMTVRYETGAEGIVINKEALTEKFFVLSSGFAGEILQKFVNYRVKFAVYGNFTGYTSKPLKDFIYESNQGKDVFFADTKEKALEWLTDNL